MSEVEKIARKYIPAETNDVADQLASDFISYLNSEEYSVPVEFPVNKTKLNQHTHIEYKTDDWRLSFNKTLLGDDENSPFYYNRSGKKLIIKDIPERMKKLIEEELENRKEK